MRASYHNGRVTASGLAYDVNHNDRNFTSDNPRHDPKKSINNQYMVLDDNGGLRNLRQGENLHNFELEYYSKHFKQHIDAQNERYLSARHADKTKTIEDYYTSSRTCPEESILQIGGKNNNIDYLDFVCAVDFYVRNHNAQHPNSPIIDVSIHADESSPHAHIRRVYLANDKYGYEQVTQHGSLEAEGYTLPKPDEPRGRYNNLKIPYSADCRNHWIDTCLAFGFSVEKEAAGASRKHIDTAQYKLERDLESLNQVTEEIEHEMSNMQFEIDMTDDLITKQKKHLRQLEAAETDIICSSIKNGNLDLVAVMDAVDYAASDDTEIPNDIYKKIYELADDLADFKKAQGIEIDDADIPSTAYIQSDDIDL